MLQVLLPHDPRAPDVAGIPTALRAAQRVLAAEPGARLLLSGLPADRWRAQIASLGPALSLAKGDVPPDLVSMDDPVLVLASGGFPETGALKAFLGQASRAEEPSRWLCGGRPVAAYFPTARRLPSGSAALAAGRSVVGEGWLDAEDPGAERSLLAELPKDTDGYLARLDRRLSIALSGLLLKTPVTPNQITTASLLLGLLGAWGLATPRWSCQALGGALLWFCCVLDGCDGEVARLKILSSPSGAAYDLAADHLAHLAVFVAIPIGVHRAHPDATFLLPASLLISGFLISMTSVWWLVLRKPEGQRGRLALLVERVASRDYVYLVAALALLGRLDWFLWAAGVGSHLFYAALWLLA